MDMGAEGSGALGSLWVMSLVVLVPFSQTLKRPLPARIGYTE